MERVTRKIKYNKNGNTITDNNIRFKKYPTLENFMKIYDCVTPEMVRGGRNPDGVGDDEVMHTDTTCIALVLKQYKPVAWVSEKSLELFPHIKKLQVINKNGRISYVIWANDEHQERAEKLANYLNSQNYNSVMLGRMLGYPEKDIQFFMMKLKEKNENK